MNTQRKLMATIAAVMLLLGMVVAGRGAPIATGAAEPTARLLESILTRLDASLYQKSERAVRAELDELIRQFDEYGIYAPRLKIHDDTITVNLKGASCFTTRRGSSKPTRC